MGRKKNNNNNKEKNDNEINVIPYDGTNNACVLNTFYIYARDNVSDSMAKTCLNIYIYIIAARFGYSAR